jgi:hypothetical protein
MMLRVCLVFIAISATNVLADEYDVRLFFPAKRGDGYRISTTVKQLQTVRTFIDGTDKGEKSEGLTVELIASITELEVNEKGRATKRQMSLENCIIDSGGEKKTLPSGLQVVAFEKNKQKVFEINGVPADPLISKALQLALPLNPEAPTDDEAFGTREKKSIGDSWPINAEFLSRSLRELYGIVATDVSGTMRLDDVVRGEQTNYLIVSGAIAIGDFSMALPLDFRMQSGRVKSTLSGRYPISQRHQQSSETSEWIAEFVAVASPSGNGKEVTVKGVIERKRTVEIEGNN